MNVLHELWRSTPRADAVSLRHVEERGGPDRVLWHGIVVEHGTPGADRSVYLLTRSTDARAVEEAGRRFRTMLEAVSVDVASAARVEAAAGGFARPEAKGSSWASWWAGFGAGVAVGSIAALVFRVLWRVVLS